MEASPEQPIELVYSLTRLSWLTGWWTWALAIVLLALALYLVIRLYRRDTVELTRATRWTLIGLRVALIIGLIFFLLGLERRARQRVTRPSEVAVLIDTSQSMSLPENDQPGGRSRIEAALELVRDTPIISSLGSRHRITVYSFDTSGELNEILVGRSEDEGRIEPDSPRAMESLDQQFLPSGVRSLAVVGCVGLVTAALLMLIAIVLGATRKLRAVPPLLLASASLMVVGGLMLGSVWTVNTEFEIYQLLGLWEPKTPRSNSSEPAKRELPADSEVMSVQQLVSATDWESVLVASGSETRIGDALRSVSARHDPTTLAAVFLLTDGESNGGTPPLAASAIFGRSGTTIYPIGFGSAKAPTNVRIVDLDAPRRVYPGDSFALNAVLQASGSASLKVQVQLFDVEDSSDDQPASVTNGEKADEKSELGELVDSAEVDLSGDGTLKGIRFEMEPTTVGRRRMAIRVVPPPGDQNENDNVRQARYEVVSERLKVLMVAGGPMREYQFVRNLLFRDASVDVDVWLQSGQPGMSQDANKLLSDFPQRAEELFEYDAIVFFDPDWLRFDVSQLELLDQWLSQQAGGMALIAGPVYWPEWTSLRTDPRTDIVRRFYPIVISSRGPLLTTGRTGGDKAWPLDFAADASIAEFLDIGESAETGKVGWSEFSGVYDYVGVTEAKPGARVYAYFGDPSTAVDDKLPIYLASQFYGAGRVYYQGSGEMWRIRGISDAFFDAYYTKLMRWISEGRLLRDSNRGLLLIDRPRAMVGDSITVRAILTDEQFQPLRVPQVEAKLLLPSGRIESIRLTPLQGEPREGTYSAKILVREAGAYEIQLPLGTALDEEILRQYFQVGLPTLELERPQRNDAVLQAIAGTTGGTYIKMDAVGTSEGGNLMEVVEGIEPQAQLTILPGTPDREFEQRRNASLMWLLCSMLTMEWVIRRLHRLA